MFIVVLGLTALGDEVQHRPFLPARDSDGVAYLGSWIGFLAAPLVTSVGMVVIYNLAMALSAGVRRILGWLTKR